MLNPSRIIVGSFSCICGTFCLGKFRYRLLRQKRIEIESLMSSSKLRQFLASTYPFPSDHSLHSHNSPFYCPTHQTLVVRCYRSTQIKQKIFVHCCISRHAQTIWSSAGRSVAVPKMLKGCQQEASRMLHCSRSLACQKQLMRTRKHESISSILRDKNSTRAVISIERISARLNSCFAKAIDNWLSMKTLALQTYHGDTR